MGSPLGERGGSPAGLPASIQFRRRTGDVGVPIWIFNSLEVGDLEIRDHLALIGLPLAVARGDLPKSRVMSLAARAPTFGASDEHLFQGVEAGFAKARPGRKNPVSSNGKPFALFLLNLPRRSVEHDFGCRRDNDRVERMMTVVADLFAFLVLFNPLQAEGFAQAVRQRARTRENAARPVPFARRIKLLNASARRRLVQRVSLRLRARNLSAACSASRNL